MPPAANRYPLAALLIAVFTVFFFSACTINPPLDLKTVVPGKPVQILSSVPFYAQQEFQCGPAALAGLLGAAGVKTSPDTLTSQVFLPGRQGSLQMELVAATRRAGRIPYVVERNTVQLFSQLAAGRPVLVLQNLRTRQFPVWHYAVLVGYDAAANQVYLNSGLEQEMVMAAPSFLRTWDWAGRWALVALRPGELPAQAEPGTYAEAVAEFEAVAGSEPAAAAWRAALRAWPGDSRPYLALGNQAYDAGALLVAADYYRRGLRLVENDPALANNLASVMGELGCPRSAIALLGVVQANLPDRSNWRATVVQTLAELAAMASQDAGYCASIDS